MYKVQSYYSQIPLCGRLVITDSSQESPNIFSKFNPLYTDTPFIRTIPTVFPPLILLSIFKKQNLGFFPWTVYIPL